VFLRSVLQLPVIANAVPNSLIIFTLIHSPKMPVLIRASRRHILEDGILQKGCIFAGIFKCDTLNVYTRKRIGTE
jgi:hypothetical protein